MPLPGLTYNGSFRSQRVAVYTRECNVKLLLLKSGKDSAGKVVSKLLEEGTLYQGKEELDPSKREFDGSLPHFLKSHLCHNTLCFAILSDKKVVVDKEIITKPKLILKAFGILDKGNYLLDYPVIFHSYSHLTTSGVCAPI